MQIPHYLYPVTQLTASFCWTLPQFLRSEFKLTISPNFRKYTNIHLQIHFYIIYACILWIIHIYIHICASWSVMPESSWPHGLSPARLLCPWNFQARTLEWVANVYFRSSSRPRDGTHGSCLSCFRRQIMYHCATWGAHIYVHKPTYMHIYMHIYQSP